MRYLPKRLHIQNRKHRRASLAIACLAVAPALWNSTLLAADTVPQSSRMDDSLIRPNPFCIDQSGESALPLQLASGSKQTVLRLKPIGKAIGLSAVESNRSEPGLPRQVRGKVLTIEEIPSKIQVNPLIDSHHDATGALVETDVVDANEGAGAAARVAADPIILRPAQTPHAEAAVAGQDTASATSRRSDGNAVEFSLSDRLTSDQAAGGQPAQRRLSPGELEPPILPRQSDVAESVVVQGEAVADSTDWIEPPAPVLQPLPDPVHSAPAPVVTAVVDQPQQRLLEKRYRPPVAVTVVPLAIKREQVEPHKPAMVQAVVAFDPDPTAAGQQPTADLVPLHLNLAQVRSLNLGGTLQTIKVADSSVCKAIAAGPNQVKLIGTGQGVTELVVWANAAVPGSPLQSRIFAVHVHDEQQDAGDSLRHKSILLTRSIRETFPDSEVVVFQRGNQLMVTGRCGSQPTAKKIMRMVRKTCTVPVKDELIVAP